MNNKCWIYTLFNKNKYLNFLQILLKGYSQVILQNKPLTGLIFCIAIFMGSKKEYVLNLLLYSLFGLILFTYFTWLIIHDLNYGLYGYNGCLISIALTIFLNKSSLFWLIFVISIFISVIILKLVNNFIKKWNIPILTLPFIIIMWSILLINNIFFSVPIINKIILLNDKITYIKIIEGIIYGFSQIFLISNIKVGILIIIGLIIESIWIFLYSFIGALLSTLILIVMNIKISIISTGLYTFNSILTTILIYLYCKKSVLDKLIYIFIGIFFTVLIQIIFDKLFIFLNIPVLTFPFLIISWLYLIITNLIDKKSLILN